MKQDFHIPDNLARYVEQHIGVNLSANFNSVAADAGYAHDVFHTVVLSVMTRTCNRCGYDPVWNPDDSESKCGRHTYNGWRYDEIFVWSERRNSDSLEESFAKWEKENEAHEKGMTVPAKRIIYGKLGW